MYHKPFFVWKLNYTIIAMKITIEWQFNMPCAC